MPPHVTPDVPATLLRRLAFFLAAGALLAQWDPVGSRSLVLEKLQQRERQPGNPFCDPAPCVVKHEVLGVYELPYKTRKARLVVTASNEEHHDCHACGPSLSFFEFTQRGAQWALTDSQFAVAEWGEFGGAYASGITVSPLSDDVYGIFLVGGSINQGEFNQSTRIMARVHDQIRLIADLKTAEDNTASIGAGSTNWRAQVTVDPRGAGFHDLIVSSSGVRDTKKFHTVERYKFNGSEYAPAP